MRLVTTILLAALLVTACEKSTDEEQIEARIAAMQEAVENKNFTDIHDHLHPDFLANGQMDAEATRRMLQMYSLQHRKIGVTLISSETTFDPHFQSSAETRLSVAVTGSSGLLPSDGSVRPVTIVWQKHAGDWLVLKADWRHLR